MSNENNVVNLNRIKNLTRDDVIDHLERCQMAAEVTLPAANMEALLTQLLGYMDNSKPDFQQKLTESERYGRSADITIENLERKVEQLAAENARIKAAGNKLFLSAISLMEDPELKIDHARDIKDWERNKTPATDAILAEGRASGVEMFAESQKEYVRNNRSELDSITRAAYCGSAVDAERFAAKIRQEAK